MGINPVNSRILPAFLIFACFVPAVFGSYRIGAIIYEANWMPVYAADHVDQLPLFMHVIGSVGFLLLGAAQMWLGLRQVAPVLHRRSGRFAAILGLIGAASGIWMTLLHGQISGPLLFWGRLAASTAWASCIVLGIAAILRRDVPNHRAWMIRAFALSLPAGTLAFILIPVMLIFGEQSEFAGEVIQVAAWPVHVAVAEFFARQKRRATQSRLIQIGAMS